MNMDVLYGALVFHIMSDDLGADKVLEKIIEGVCKEEKFDLMEFKRYLGVLLDVTPFVEKILNEKYEAAAYIYQAWESFIEDVL